MLDDERLTSLTDNAAPTDGDGSVFDRRMQLFALAVLLGACLLWVAGRAVLHRTVAAPAPGVTTLAQGVLTTSAESTRAPGSPSDARSEQESMFISGETDVRSQPESDAVNSRADDGVEKQSTSRQRRNQVAATASTSTKASCRVATSLLSLNQATASQLDALPGVGPVLAQRIITWRAAHQGFSDVHELQEVPGIGPSKFARIRGLVRVR